MAAPLTAQELQDKTDALLGDQPSQNSVEIKRLKADLAAATPGTVTYDNLVKKIEALGGTVKGSTTTTVTPKVAPQISFNYKEMVKKDRFSGVPGKTTPFKNHPGTVVPDFINGGTKAEKAALARMIANMQITSDMATSDVAKIKRARQWYTGQTKGSSKGKAAVYDPGSVKDKILKAGGATNPRSDPRKDIKGKLTRDANGNIIQWGDQKAATGFKWVKSVTGVGYELVPIPPEEQIVAPPPEPSPSPSASPSAADTEDSVVRWLMGKASPNKPKGNKKTQRVNRRRGEVL